MNIKKSILVVTFVLMFLLVINYFIVWGITGYAGIGSDQICVNYPPNIEPINEQEITVGETFIYNLIVEDDDDRVFVYQDDTDLFDINPMGEIKFLAKEEDVGKHYIKITVDDYSECSNRLTEEIFELNILSNETVFETNFTDYLRTYDPKLVFTIIPLIFIVLLIIMIKLFHIYHKIKKPKVIVSKKTIIKNKIIHKPIKVIKQDTLNIKRKLSLLKKSYQEKYITKATYLKAKKNLEKKIQKIYK